VTLTPLGQVHPIRAFAPPQVLGLNEQTQDLLNELVVQWAWKLPRNLERMIYLDAKNTLDDLGVSLPPSLVDRLDVVVGWPEKAVYEVANRIVFERILSPDDSRDPFDLKRVLYDNRFAIEFPQAVASSLAQSCAFVSTTPGDVAEGEAPALIMFHSALWSTGIWDRRRRALRGGMLISEVDKMGLPVEITVMTPAEHVVCAKGSQGWYVSAVIPHALGRTPMEILPFRPTTDRPFGRSRIDRTVMSLTNRAVRAGARLEVHSELFTSMKLLLLGADEEAFKDASGKMVPLWSFFLGRMNMLSKDEDGDTPELEIIRSESPEPHIAIGRDLASKFSGHTGVPMSSLGISTDNPESQGAKQEARQDIIVDVEKQHVIYSDALLRTFENAIMIRDNMTTPPEGILDLSFKWRRGDRPSLVSIADAGTKQVSAIPSLADTTVGMELVGMEPDQIDRAESELRRRRGSDSLNSILDRATGATSPEELGGASVTEDAAAIKAKADALGVLIRAGVDPEEAARRVGLSGLEFTGATPVALRLPESQARSLEER